MRSSLARALLSCGWLASACTRAGEAPPDESSAAVAAVAPAAPEIPAGAFVILADTSTIFTHAEATSGRVLPELPEASGQGRAVEVLADAGERLHVRTLGLDHPSPCATNFEFAHDLELSFWVDRGDLRQLLVAPVSVSFPDGTSLELAAGVPVLAAGPEGELLVSGQRLHLPLDAAQVGLSYTPPEPASGRHGYRPPLHEGEPLHYGDHHVVVGPESFAHGSAIQPDEGGPEAAQLVELDNACGHFTLRRAAGSRSTLYAMKGPKNAIPRVARNFDPDMRARSKGMLGVMMRSSDTHADSPYGADFGLSPMLDLDCTPRWTIASGGALEWADGLRAGAVLRAHELPKDTRLLDQRVCFEVSGLELCVDEAKLGRSFNLLCPDPGPGAGFAGLGKRVPRTRQAKARVGGGLDRKAVREVILAHIDEVRGCYANEIRGRVNLQGRALVGFEIDAKGRVRQAEIRESTLRSHVTGTCLLTALQSWRFPKPKDGEAVEVVYPFTLSPG